MPLVTGTAAPDILPGTALADTLQGLASDDILYAFDGNDLLQGGDGDDLLYGGSGDDTMDGGAGEDLFYGQSGIDTVSYATALAGLTLNLAVPSGSTGDATGDFFLSVERFILSSLADTLLGGGLAEHVQGGGGNDMMFGMGGADSLFGDTGNDTLIGGVEGDLLDGGNGVDTVSYSSSGEAIVLDLGAPSFTSGDASGDVYVGIEGLMMSDLGDLVRLEGGTIRLVDGDGGNDSLTGSAFADTLRGGTGNDLLTGGNGRDLLDGGDGNDLLLGGAGGDAFVGGADFDIVVYSGPIKVNLANAAKSSGDAFGDTFSGVEQLRFLGNGSTYVGGAADIGVTLFGLGMTCFAGAGAEVFHAESGNMSVSYQNAASRVELTGAGDFLGARAALGDRLINVSLLTLSKYGDVFEMQGGFSYALTKVLAGNGNDRLTFSGFLDANAEGEGGNDTFTGTASLAQIDGGSGDDTVALTSTGFFSFQSAGQASILGGSGNDTVTLTYYATNTVDGGDGNDIITVNGGNLNSVAGPFDIDGGAGNDILDVTAVNSIGVTVPQVALQGGLGDDSMTLTTSGVAEIYGDSGNDDLTLTATVGSLYGGIGNDSLTFFSQVEFAIVGPTQLLGGDGDDVLTLMEPDRPGAVLMQPTLVDGGSGNDAMIGSNGVFASQIVNFDFHEDWGNDTISNFHDGTDLILFSGAAPDSPDQFADLLITGDTSFTQIEFKANSIRIDGLDVAGFTGADVLFL